MIFSPLPHLSSHDPRDGTILCFPEGITILEIIELDY